MIRQQKKFIFFQISFQNILVTHKTSSSFKFLEASLHLNSDVSLLLEASSHLNRITRNMHSDALGNEYRIFVMRSLFSQTFQEESMIFLWFKLLS